MTSPHPQPRAGVSAIPEYAFGTAENLPPETVRLNTNENQFGASPRVLEAIRSAPDVAALHLYPAIAARPLNDALAALHGLDANNVLSVGGGELLLPLAVSAFAGHGDEVLAFDDGFPKYLNYTLGAGARFVTASRRDDPVASLLSAVTPATKVVIVDNPGNPTGKLLPIEAIAEIQAGLPPDVLFMLDEAYVEFSDFDDAGLALAKSVGNMLVLRTFSKAYALAGLRMGWAFGSHEVIWPIRRVSPSYPIPRPSLAGALAALEDQAHMRRSVAEIRRLRDLTAERFRAGGWHVGPSQGNFILVEPGARADADVSAAVERLAQAHILARKLPDFAGRPAMRLTIGREEHMTRVAEALGLL